MENAFEKRPVLASLSVAPLVVTIILFAFLAFGG